MSNYNITKFSGATITVPDSTLLKFDNSYTNGGLSVTLIGQNKVGFGSAHATNVVQTIENFAGNTPPPGAIRGQLWFDMASGNAAGNTGTLKVWTGADPTDISGYNVNTDSANPLVLSNWKTTGVDGITPTDIGTIGTPFTNLYVTNGFITNGQMETLFVGNVATYPSNGTIIDLDFFTPDPDSNNDTVGIRLGKLTNRFRESHVRNGFVHNMLNIGDQTNNFKVSLLADNVANNTLIPGNGQSVSLGSTASLSKRFFEVNAQTVDCISFIMSDSPANGLASNFVPTQDNVYVLGNSLYKFADIQTMKVTVDTVERQLSTSTVGTALNPFQAMYAVTFNGTAIQAEYADLAERYEADRLYPVGTIVKIGGEKEITATEKDFDDFIGVTSEKPAYLMNKDAGPNETHPAIALVGRIPVRVVGKIKKGQKIVPSEIPGVGMATSSQVLIFIGYALKDKETTEEGLVEAVIGV